MEAGQRCMYIGLHGRKLFLLTAMASRALCASVFARVLLAVAERELDAIVAGGNSASWL